VLFLQVLMWSKNLKEAEFHFKEKIYCKKKISNHPDSLERDLSAAHPDFENPERSGKMKVVSQVLKVWKD